MKFEDLIKTLSSKDWLLIWSVEGLRLTFSFGAEVVVFQEVINL